MKRRERRLVVNAWWEGTTIDGRPVAIFSMRIYDRRSSRVFVEAAQLDPRAVDRTLGDARALYAIADQLVRKLRRVLRHRWRVEVLGANYQQRLYVLRSKRRAMELWNQHELPRLAASDVALERARFAAYVEERYGATPARVDAP